MLKFVERTEEQCIDYLPCVTFILETDSLSVKLVDDNVYSYENEIKFYDNEKSLFSLSGRLYYCPARFGWEVIFSDTRLIKEYAKVAPKEHDGFDGDYHGVCVDPRVIMACEMYTFLGVDYKYHAILEEALNPLPSYEEAEKWLFDNKFAIGDPKGVWCSAQRCTVHERMDKRGDHYDPHYVNLPPKVEEAFREIRKRAREEEEAIEKRMMERMAREGK